MRRAGATALLLALAACSGGPGGGAPADDRLVVIGPSLVELMCASGLEDAIVGVDRYSTWPPSVRTKPVVGGYADPSFEAITGLRPTSLHVVGTSAPLAELAGLLGIPLHSYRFDTLEDVFASADTIRRLYGNGNDPGDGGGAASLSESLEAALDSIALSRAGLPPLSVLLVVYHEPGASSMTIAGRGTFLAGVLERLGCSVAAPASGGPWPVVSVEGVLDLAPDRVVGLFPDARDTSVVAAAESAFWSELGWAPPLSSSLFDPFLLIPGARIGETAGRLDRCLR